MTTYDNLDAISFICNKLGFEVIQQMHADDSLEHRYANEWQWHRILCCEQLVLIMPCIHNAWFTCGRYSLVMEFETRQAHDILRAMLSTQAFKVDNCNAKRVGNPFYGHYELLDSVSIDEFKVNVDMSVPGDWSQQVIKEIGSSIKK